MSIKNILPKFDLNKLDLIIVENIGNLVCPSEFDIGENIKVALLSIPEGDDKIEKYPLMFAKADALILTKYDFKDYFNFDENRIKEQGKAINNKLKIFTVNSKEEGSLSNFKKWLINKMKG